ncbi:hypothetical protein GCM10009840_17880 [Pseudolysinimonas kribbensis]|uniref:Phage gp6-like head-tail connector protein n=1 Tax=Pseudolysinimonas kribbensis TaxID=433641 RepID=A0ABQ6K2P1_9MICO|nr:hypothetical protein [Pseudolysinimonas kribbensis]GMA93830.1 hypothetical protein GCM10025881_06540 [Pseudolysinimonas kribbensis]
MTAEDLSQYVGANADDAAFVASCWARADALVTAYVGSAEVPSAILDGATLDVGAELYHRRNAPSGITQFATAGDASPIRLARDPMTSAYPVLARWVGVGVA